MVEFYRLANVAPEMEWFASLTNPSTRCAYENVARDFMQFTGIAQPEEFRSVTRSHIIACRRDLQQRSRGGSTTGQRLASLFEHLRNQEDCLIHIAGVPGLPPILR